MIMFVLGYHAVLNAHVMAYVDRPYGGEISRQLKDNGAGGLLLLIIIINCHTKLLD